MSMSGSLSPCRKKFKNNEILSSYSSYVAAIEDDDRNPMAANAGDSPMDSMNVAPKRKFVSCSPDEDEFKPQHSKQIKKSPLLSTTVEIASDSEDSCEGDAVRDESFSSDKENVTQEIDYKAPVVRQEDKIEYIVPEHYHTLEEHERDDKKSEAKLKRLLKAIGRSSISSPSKTKEPSTSSVSTNAMPTTSNIPQLSSIQTASLLPKPDLPPLVQQQQPVVKEQPSATTTVLQPQQTQLPTLGAVAPSQPQLPTLGTVTPSQPQLPTLGAITPSRPQLQTKTSPQAPASLTPPQPAPLVMPNFSAPSSQLRPAGLPVPSLAAPAAMPSIPTFNFTAATPTASPLPGYPAMSGTPELSGGLFSLGSGSVKKPTGSLSQRRRRR